MSSNSISPRAYPAPTPAPAYRSKKKLRMESHYFNTTLLLKKTSSTPSTSTNTVTASTITAPIEEDEIEYPTAKYKTNSKDWFVYAFGIGSDGPSQLSDGGRPAHYGATCSSASTSEVPRTWQGLTDASYHYHGDNGVSTQARPGLTYIPAPESENPIMSISKKRSIPEDFVTDYDQRRERARARIDADWEFGRAVARKQLVPKSKTKPSIPKKVTETRKSERIMGRTESVASTTASKSSGKEIFGSAGMVILRMNLVTVGQGGESD